MFIFIKIKLVKDFPEFKTKDISVDICRLFTDIVAQVSALSSDRRRKVLVVESQRCNLGACGYEIHIRSLKAQRKILNHISIISVSATDQLSFFGSQQSFLTESTLVTVTQKGGSPVLT